MNRLNRANKVTSIDVAARAGVSQSAVSRVFTKGASVSPKTMAKVQKAATELGYRPNVLARAARTGKSRIIGFMVAYLDNQFYPETLQKLSEKLAALGYHILIFTIDNRPDQIARTVEELLAYQVDAIIAASVSMSNDLAKRCRAIGVPIVLYNRAQGDDSFSSITSDNLGGGRAMAHHFADIGIERPAYIAGWEDASTQRDREIGFRQGLFERGLSLFARGEGEFHIERAREAARAMFHAAKKPDGVFVANDHMAFGVMDVLRFELGLRIPEDVAVASYDDVAIASWPAYDLTSVRQPANRMVDAAVQALVQAIEEPDAPPVQKIIEGPLVIRGSTKRKGLERKNA